MQTESLITESADPGKNQNIKEGLAALLFLLCFLSVLILPFIINKAGGNLWGISFGTWLLITVITGAFGSMALNKSEQTLAGLRLFVFGGWLAGVYFCVIHLAGFHFPQLLNLPFSIGTVIAGLFLIVMPVGYFFPDITGGYDHD